MKDIIGDENPDPEEINKKIEEINKKIKALKKSKKWKKKARRYNYNYALCEILNIFCIILCFIILNALVGNGDKQFWKYGTNVLNHNTTTKEVNPMCNMFPTEVSCTVRKGGVDGNVDIKN